MKKILLAVVAHPDDESLRRMLHQQTSLLETIGLAIETK